MTGKAIIGKEIFSAGTWNSDVWTVSDLEKIAANFKLVRAIHKAPLKLGHAEGQQFMGQEDGAPALGWVSDVRVEGIKLVADFSDVPSRVWDLIETGRYKRVSAEIYEDVKLDGKPIGPVLRAVALLGADIPAVTNLADLHTVLMSEKSPFNHGRLRQFTSDNPKYKATPMPEPTQLDAASIAKLTERMETLERANKEKDASLKQYQEREELLKLEVKVSKFVAAKSTVLAKADELVKAMKMTPALRDKLEIKIAVQEKKFTEVDGLQVPADWLMDLFAEVSPKIEKGEKSKHVFRKNPLEEKDAIEDPGEQIALETRKLIVANPKMEYGAAQRSVMELKPELAKAYMEQNQTAEPGQSTQSALDEARKGA